MKSSAERNDASTSRVSSGYLDCILDCLGAGRYEYRFLRRVPRRKRVQMFGDGHRGFVRRNHDTGVSKPIDLFEGERLSYKLPELVDSGEVPFQEFGQGAASEKGSKVTVLSRR